MWLAKLTERGMLRPSFVPPYDIRRLREFTRLRADLVHERTRYWARLEKLLERALIKISAVVSSLDTLPARAMIEALIAGQRNPRALADLAVGRLRPKRAALAEALEGRFEPHHGELARILLDQIDALTAQIGQLTARITELIAAIPAAQGIDADGATGPGAGTGPGAPVLPAVMRLDEITGCGVIAAQAIIAEIGLDMAVFGTPGRLVSWAKRCPQTRQSGTKTSTGKAGKGNPYLNGVLGEIAASAGRTDTFPGERYRRLARRRGKRRHAAARQGNRHLRAAMAEAAWATARTRTRPGARFRRLARRFGKGHEKKAAIAVARTLICIAWAVMARGQDYADAGEDYYDQRDQRNREHLIRRHQHALARLGCQVTLIPPGDGSPPPGQAA